MRRCCSRQISGEAEVATQSCAIAEHGTREIQARTQVLVLVLVQVQAPGLRPSGNSYWWVV